ncbi:MAG: hypothetical protein K2M36_05255 [Clostridia bacterium]|nr:hypothetical protein [Clostridia bacterium]
MFNKSGLKKAIKASEREIETLEKKRTRSLSALMEAQITNKPPKAADLEYFKIYSNLIELERQNLRQLKSKLEKA